VEGLVYEPNASFESPGGSFIENRLLLMMITATESFVSAAQNLCELAGKTGARPGYSILAVKLPASSKSDGKF
jgi:hypothetical protein